jgi:hypothetical protein
MLYHLLPVVFWLLAIGGSIIPLFFVEHYAWGFIPAALAWLSVVIIRHIQRHTNSIEECLVVALFLGVASYWLPSVLFLIIPIWGYLIYHNLFSFRSFVATLIGYAVVAVWATIFIVLGWITNPWAHFFATENAWGWIPTGAFILAYIASTIARQNLRVR